MSVSEPIPPSEHLDRLRDLVNTRPWEGLRPMPVAVLLGGMEALELAGVSVWWGFTVLGAILAVGTDLWLKEYYRTRFGITAEASLRPLPSPPLLLLAAACVLIAPVVAARLNPGAWPGLAYTVDLALVLVFFAWWNGRFRRWHWLIWAAVCGGALLLPHGEGRKRENLSLLAVALGIAVDSVLNHALLMRALRPQPEEPDGQRI